MVVDVPEIDLSIGRKESAGTVREDVEDVTFRGEMPAEREHEPFHTEYLAKRALVERGEDFFLQSIHEFVKLIQKGEICVDCFVHDGVHEPRRPRSDELRLLLEKGAGMLQ